ncbi:XRE family transcriptional regulator [Ligilactobacillus sp. WILCCON 0076]|uniref:XRE family transcriptional regulator n=1 Tax=Ligilactobacillus ubinensis TaxID=2876789 RepID=A0A9X2JLH0_9LACO|nr:XRE family transcriptional regulator [Ligilactobacillus ubinensis]MCP0887007.1 XRE family transcriptional regulator [Ligilactobacillus ubinensis]
MSDLGNKEIMSENIKYYMKSRGIDRNKLVADLNLKYTTVSDWINGKTYPRIDKIELLANYFNIEKIDLVERKLPNVIPVIKTVKIPLLGTIACGDSILAEENIDGYIDEPSTYLPSGKCFYLKAEGFSMKPTIPNGSKVLIRQQNDVEDGEIAAVLLMNNNEATLKRIKRSNGVTFLIPDNSDYSPIIINEDNPARILGKAIRIVIEL